MKLLNRIALATLASLGLPATTFAQTLVTPGADLAALIAAAPDGEVLEFVTNDTFVGNFTWTGKQLTFRAAPGFTPTLRAFPAQNCLEPTPGFPTTGGHFQGLRIEGDQTFVAPSFPVRVIASDASSEALTLSFEGCAFVGRPTVNGSGYASLSATFEGCTFEDDILATGGFNAPVDLRFEDCQAEGRLQVYCGPLLGIKTYADLTVRRSVVGGGLELTALGGSALDVLVESSVIDGALGSEGAAAEVLPFGVRLFGDVLGSFVNVTVTGCATALQGNAGVTWQNMLLVGNAGPVLVDVPATNISHSLIEDGTFDGVNGNFSGLAVWDDAYRLIACSAGLDAGDNAALGLGATDLNGAPRIQDNGGLGVALVNVGATEATGSLPASAKVENGTGVNPTTYTANVLPLAGGTFLGVVLTPPGSTSLASVVVVDAPGPPTTSPAWTGELLLALSPAAIFHISPGDVHTISVPSTCALIGTTVPTQGFSLLVSGGAVTPFCHNRLDLVIGG